MSTGLVMQLCRRPVKLVALKENFILSENLFAAAKSRGWWKEGTAFDFTKMYSGGEYAHKYYSGRRMWRGFQMAKPSLKLPPNYEDR